MKILVLVYPGLTLQDVLGPVQTWMVLPDHEVQLVWKKQGPVLSDSGFPVVATHDYDSAWKDPDILLVGGGSQPTLDLLEDEETLAFVADRGERAKWITSVCTGSLILGAAGLLQGYRSACHWSMREHLAAFGAIPSSDRVVFDRNRASGGGVTAGIDFGITVVSKLAGEPMGRFAELLLEYAPAPPFGCGRPEIADPETLAMAQAMLSKEMPPGDAIARAAARLRARKERASA
ncbi:DJ-1/PfpI family protein [Polyangium aurulentum]|uniref:DJ-1/PfpI family protein n=1 Tax=Polyangium aurulentum TaxID=2567896 RepID=UPI0010ADE246|nr:DJ-1/PfpI family protein [Polyangium aurulentum]UQA55517.1 DJ-1/PfpI family protein [Polyangium aurulentum]